MNNSVPSNNGDNGSSQDQIQHQTLRADLTLRGNIPIAQQEQRRSGPQHNDANGHGRQPLLNRFSVLASVFVGIALIVVGLLQFGVYSRQAKIMKTQTALAGRQITIVEAEHRPWLAISQSAAARLTAMSPLVFDGTNWRITVQYGIKNVSKTPAFNANIGIRAYVHFNTAVANAALAHFCQEEKEPTRFGDDTGTGSVLFPDNEALIQDVPLEFSKQEVDSEMTESGFHAYLMTVRDRQRRAVRGLFPTDTNIGASDIAFLPSLPSYAD
jgi:hypothetical protein